MKILDRLKKKLFRKFFNFFKYELFSYYNDNMFIVLENLKSRGYNPEIILDIGAYKGGWTSELISIFPDSNFIMFEAQNDKEVHLNNISLRHNNVTYFIGLLGSDIEKKKNFYLMETGSSVFYENTNHSRSVVQLDVNTVDNLLSEKIIQGNVLLKIDVQGYEIEVLKGALNTLKFVDIVLLEVSTLNFNEGAPLFDEIIEFMKTMDYVVYDISSLKRTNKEKALFQLDIFFCKINNNLRDIRDFG